MIKVLEAKVIKRWDSVMESIGVEHVTIDTRFSEIGSDPTYYGVENGVTIDWMMAEARYWLSCYYETGHCRCDDRFIDRDNYKVWVSETGKLKRLINFLGNFDEDLVVAEVNTDKTNTESLVKTENHRQIEQDEEQLMENSVSRSWKVYGIPGHRQKESFNPSYTYDWSKDGDIRIIKVNNSDTTGTNDYSVITITRNTYDECQLELNGQLNDGIFENSRVGEIVEIHTGKSKRITN